MQIAIHYPDKIVCQSLCNTSIIRTVYNKSHDKIINNIMEFPTDEEAYEFFTELQCEQ